MNILGIIPARGGSKRLPGKNIIDFMGRPIITYTIEAALQSGICDRVVVSTEDSEIGDVAQSYGAEIAIRPAHLATDKSTINQVCLDYLTSERAAGRSYDIICCLYATAPLRTAEDIRKTVELIELGVCDFSMAVTDYSHPPYLAMQLNDQGFLRPRWPELTIKKSQEMGEFLIGNGSTYAATVPAFLSVKDFIGPNMRGYMMPRSRSVDIDAPIDLDMAQFFVSRSEA